MNNSENASEVPRFRKIGRRWIAALCAMLAINGLMVVLAFFDLSGRASISQLSSASASAGEMPEVAEASVAMDRPVNAGKTSEAVSAETSPPKIAGPAEVAKSAIGNTDDAPPTENEATQVTERTDATLLAELPAVPGDKSNPSVDAGIPAADNIQVATTNEGLDTPAAKIEGEESLAGAMVIVNPPATGGAVHYLVDGKAISLMPGECHRLPAGQQQLVFHRGDELDDVERPASAGVFAFSVSEAGWNLTPASGEAGRRLLRLCRQVE